MLPVSGARTYVCSARARGPTIEPFRDIRGAESSLGRGVQVVAPRVTEFTHRANSPFERNDTVATSRHARSNRPARSPPWQLRKVVL
jgi:hypothetical protein